MLSLKIFSPLINYKIQTFDVFCSQVVSIRSFQYFICILHKPCNKCAKQFCSYVFVFLLCFVTSALLHSTIFIRLNEKNNVISYKYLNKVFLVTDECITNFLFQNFFVLEHAEWISWNGMLIFDEWHISTVFLVLCCYHNLPN